MLKWLEKFILKKIVKRAIGKILDNEAATTIFVEEKINEINISQSDLSSKCTNK